MSVLILYLFNNFLSEIPVGSVGGSKYGDKCFDRILDIGIPDFWMNLMSCHGFLKNIKFCCDIKMSLNDVGILFIKRIYYFGMQW